MIFLQKIRDLKKSPYSELFAAVIVLLCLVTAGAVLKHTINFDVLAFLGDLFYLKYLPSLGNNTGFGLILLFGLLTSIHCVGMCGGILLTQCVQKDGYVPAEGKPQVMLLPAVLYNTGQMISYTVVGGVVGGIGQVLTLSGLLKGLIPIAGGIFMVIMAVNLLDLFPALRFLNLAAPKFIAKRIRGGGSSHGPLIIGLLTGLMPCGPLQMLQLYALGTRSVVYGAASMFVFALGTVPGLFAFGAFSTMISRKFSKIILKTSAVVVAVLGFVMIGRGLALIGVSLPMLPDKENTAQEYADLGCRRWHTDCRHRDRHGLFPAHSSCAGG
ncbi:MAG: hypothetical protein A4E55_00976 [Pelotomaculum sp. PtaU1.Bin035]|nr:MAG: hypothetical protein A4E55_00976 [Pelotomaculum sp. PtaU1.Bin035]